MKTADGNLAQHLGPGDGVLDIGANQGMLTADYAKAVGPTGYVLAVEPNPATFENLQHGTRNWPQVMTLCAAVGAAEGRTMFYPDGVLSSRWVELVQKPQPGFTVPMTTIDLLAARVPKLRGIKVDVQGGEMDVLLGAVETLRNANVIWQIELWPRGLSVAGSSATAVCDALKAVGLHPMTRNWETVAAQAATLTNNGSYLDLVCRHVH